VAVLGNENPKASIPGEVLPLHEFYSYEAKYIDENGAMVEIPAKLSARDAAKVRALAVRVFRALDSAGMGRVDFFLTPRGRFVVNEINTLPGFTKISMYPKLWGATGVPYSELLDRLIKLAIEQKAKKSKLQRNFS
jgi:D-alanine-D-alanine ligase